MYYSECCKFFEGMNDVEYEEYFINKILSDEDLSNWDVSNVQKFNWMFCDYKKFNSDLSKWNVSKAIKMTAMFDNCKMFNCDLSNWDVSNVTDMGTMFDECTTLEKNNKIPKWYSN